MNLVSRFKPCIPCDCPEESQQPAKLTAEHLECFAEDSEWSIQLRSRPVMDVPLVKSDPVHLYISLIDPNGEEVGQMHGLPFDKKTGESGITGFFGDTLRAVFNRHMDPQKTTLVETLWAGDRNEFASKITRAAEEMHAINEGGLKYQPYVPLFSEQNSNAISHRVIEVMGLTPPNRIQSSFFSFGRDLVWAPGFTQQDFNGAPHTMGSVNEPIPWGSHLLDRLSNALENLSLPAVTAGVLNGKPATRMARERRVEPIPATV